MERKHNISEEDKRKAEEIGGQDSFTDEVIPIIQENTVINNQLVETGKVHIKRTVSKEDVHLDTPIINELYDIKRVPVSGQILETPPPAMRNDGDTFIIPVIKEIPVIVKRYEVIEEIHITRKHTETPLIQKVTLSTQNVNVERTKKET
jgi:stress response protein YsnF